MLATVLLTLAASQPLGQADTTFRLPRGAVVEISSFSQPVMVTGTSGDNISVTGADVESDGNRVSIDGRMFGAGSGGPIMVRIPLSARLTIDVVNGHVAVINAPENVEIDAVNGRVEVNGGKGRLVISATGDIIVNDFAGTRLGIEGLAGSILIRGATGTVRIENVNGPMLLERVVSRDVTIESTNGQVRWIGDFDPSGRYRIDSHNGGVELTVPRTLNARIELETFNGGISSAIPATITGNEPGKNGPPAERRIVAIFGRGQATIAINTFNGGVQVKANAVQ